jgi:hypothetical protein
MESWINFIRFFSGKRVMLLTNLLKSVQKSIPLQFVGVQFNATTGNPTTCGMTSLTGGIATFPSPGDLVIAAAAFKGSNDRDFIITTGGYTEIADLYASAFENEQMGVFYKVLTTYETSVEFTTTDGLGMQNGSSAVYVWRGAKLDNPLDVTTTTNTKLGQPDAPSITTVTNGAVVIAVGAAAGSNGAPQSDLTSPSGMTNFYQQRTGEGTNGQTVLGFASIARPTAGTYDPPTFNGSSTNNDNGACAVTIAIRPS